MTNEKNKAKKALVVGISGASGAIYGIRLLEALQNTNIDTHLVMSRAARITIAQETEYAVSDVEKLAAFSHAPDNIGASIASGSFPTLGMVVVPCSLKSLSGIANSYTTDLLTRAADVTIKEGRPLILVVRETPLHLGHLRLMTQASKQGAVIMPPVPAFYSHPKNIEDMIQQTVGRILARLNIQNDLYQKWNGL